MTSTLLRAIALGITLGPGAVACSDTTPSAPVGTKLTAPQGLIVSNASLTTTTAGGGSAAAGSHASTTAFVSAVPGTFPNVVSVVLRNVAAGGPSRTVPVTGGGFDPVGIEARFGDELWIRVVGGIAEGRPPISTNVPAQRPPQVVRMDPANSQIDVETDSEILVVFSEPVDVASGAFAPVTLLQDGNVIEGRAHVSADGLTARFVPTASLQHRTTYEVAIDRDIRDRDGSRLQAPMGTAFTTVSSTPVGELLFAQLSDQQIYRTNLDGTGLVRLTQAGDNSGPAWSPDGRRIAFTRNVPGLANNGWGTSDIHLMDADGANARPRTVASNFNATAWSPDGRTLAVSDEGLYYAELHLLSVVDDGSPPRLLATAARSPSWSPDGGRIAFVRTSGDDGYHRVYVMNADGTDIRPITDDDGGGIYGLAWSPDGKRIAYSKCLEGGCDLYVMDANGAGTVQITSAVNAQQVTWSPDGMWIAFTMSQYSGQVWQPSIAYVAAEGGAVRLVAIGGFDPSWRP